MSAQTSVGENETRKIELYQPPNCPNPFDAAIKAVLGEHLSFGEIHVCWGMSFFPIGQGILKLTINHPETRGLQFGIWDVPRRRALFCNVDHPGLYLVFLLLHRYEDKGQIYRYCSQNDDFAILAAAKYIVELCFPFHPDSFDRDQEFLQFSFPAFIELMGLTNQLEKNTCALFARVLRELQDRRLSSVGEDRIEKRKEIYRKTGSEDSFSTDPGLRHLVELEKNIRARFLNALMLIR